jgi:hypothetical protein
MAGAKIRRRVVVSFAHDTAALKRTQSRHFAQIATEEDDVDFRSDDGARLVLVFAW